MLNIRRYNGISCQCKDLEEKEDVVGLLIDYNVAVDQMQLTPENLETTIKKLKIKLCLKVVDGEVKDFHYNKLTDYITPVQFLNKLINCKDEKDKGI